MTPGRWATGRHANGEPDELPGSREGGGDVQEPRPGRLQASTAGRLGALPAEPHRGATIGSNTVLRRLSVWVTSGQAEASARLPGCSAWPILARSDTG